MREREREGERIRHPCQCTLFIDIGTDLDVYVPTYMCSRMLIHICIYICI